MCSNQSNLLDQQRTTPEFLFIAGSNLDKRHQVLISQIINRDMDIHKLIRKAYLTRPRISTLIIFISILFFLLPAAYSGIDALKDFIEDSRGKLFLYLVLILCLINSLHSIITRTVRVVYEMKSLWTYIQIRYFKHLLPKKPLDLWHHYPANITDGQIALYVQRLLNRSNTNKEKACKLIYAGEPYMSHYLLDSIDVDWKIGKQTRLLKRHRIRHHYRSFFRQFAIQSVYANATDKLNKIYSTNNAMRQTSNNVFGLMFASNYISSFLEKFDKNKNHVCVNISDIQICDQQIIENVMQHITSPYRFDIVTDKSKLSSYHLTLNVKQFLITFPKEKVEESSIGSKLIHYPKRLLRSMYSQIAAKSPIHIPVKRLFLKASNESDKPFILNDLSAFDENIIVLLGGAEQSLPQCHLINRQRWTLGTSTAKKIGFAENAFDSSDSVHYRFYVGTEGFVYGRYMNQIIAPDDSPNKAKRAYAEKICLQLDQKDILILYGYHAISTKIAALKHFLDHIQCSSCKSTSEFDPMLVKSNQRCLMVTYRYSIDQLGKSMISKPQPEQEIWDLLKHYWDQHNPMDNLMLSPQSNLASIKTEIVDILPSTQY